MVRGVYKGPLGRSWRIYGHFGHVRELLPREKDRLLALLHAVLRERLAALHDVLRQLLDALPQELT